MEINIREALRYVGVHQPDAAMLHEMQLIADEVLRKVTPRSVYRVCTVQLTAEGCLLPEIGVTLPGRMARRMLETCHHTAVLACTLGPGFDGLLRTCQQQDMARAVMMDACGSAYVEAACDAAERELAATYPGQYLTDRFSPGYGDLPLDVQQGMLAGLNAMRRIGVTALPSCLMNPSKSVTAVIGLSDQAQKARIRGCGYCAMAKTCTLRKRGESCHA